MIKDAFLWYKDDEETVQFTVESKLVNHDSTIKEEQSVKQTNFNIWPDTHTSKSNNTILFLNNNWFNRAYFM